MVKDTGNEAGTADGMNEKGLVANLLFLVESEYPEDEVDKKRQGSISAWTRYILAFWWSRHHG
ncbi:MAG: hypothetical protein MUC41_13095 [Syntrophobacteraceae bacterium]|jgi:choloylglycine hydrolase|nr:hypothetical protein [Syntrophobacteraceae bacterium]